MSTHPARVRADVSKPSQPQQRARLMSVYVAGATAYCAWAYPSQRLLITATPMGPDVADLVDRLGADGLIVNVSRGFVIDEPAMIAALRDGRLGGAALDVFEQEPLKATEVFADCPNLVLTPHIAGVSLESNERVSELIARKVLEALQ